MVRSLLSAISFLMLASPAFAAGHVDATNCEIFVDKVQLFYGSHASRSFQPFVKILPQRLDGAIKEVGYRFTSQAQGVNGGGDQREPWSDRRMNSVSPVNDYFTITSTISVASDFGRATYDVVFYVITTAGTTYWAKPAGGGNFHFDSDLFARIWGPDPYGTMREAKTQSPGLRELNPQNCY